MSEERAYGWDDEIQHDGGQYTLLPPGEYPFTVLKFERGRYEGGEKIPACNKAIVTIEVDAGAEGISQVEVNFMLHSKLEGLLCSFFKCIGHRKHGEPLRMNWPATIGCSGWCKLAHRDGKDGKKFNDIKQWIDPEKAPKAEAATAAPFQPWQGQF